MTNQATTRVTDTDSGASRATGFELASRGPVGAASFDAAHP